MRGLERVVGDEALRHYRYTQVSRASGPPRVLEAPKPRLKALQRRLLHELLDFVPVHPAAHGFVGGRSARTHAAAHVGRRVVVRVDLEDFFAGVTAARVFGIFRACGYPEGVAHVLTGLCTNAVPPEQSVPGHWRLSRRLAAPHLPQGAPTSPALANLAAFALDRRLRASRPRSALRIRATPTTSCSPATRICVRRSRRSRRSRAPRASA